ncbi:MAG: hypothetical protein OXI13_00600 [Gammaproteobacteria bacterium]|nr:hypothetical protein [Gammaproteobacteria bacterium]
MSVIERIRRDREDLARVLKKHAGIRRIVEDLYPDSAHFIYELLQNAEDTGASETTFRLSENKLVFEHNGREFDEADIRAITDIGEGTKAEYDEQIGRFGIGFKAVFAYTETPHIWSPSYSFKISEMVLPSALHSCPKLHGCTRFEFPFDSEKKPKTQAFSEVRDCLEEISDRTLLFLSNIEEINWRVEGNKKVRLLRVANSDQHLEVLREIDGGSTETSHFLSFREQVEDLERQNVAIAFELEPRPEKQRHAEHGSVTNRFRIIPAERGCVAVYFTAAKETSNMRFHIHAPFVPELSRSSIKKTDANEPLFEQIARLAAQSLTVVRDFGLLDRDFLAVLPNSNDDVPENYEPIRTAIVKAMNERPLTPTHAIGHAPASRLLQAEAGLKDLLDRDDLRFLVDNCDGDPDWAVAATQRNSRVDRFLHDLDVGQWGVEQFMETLKDRCSTTNGFCHLTHTWKQGPDQSFLDWMRRKPEEWHRKLYAFLHRQLGDHLYRFNNLSIVRRSDGEFGTGHECYFPTPEIHEDPIHPRVAKNTYAGGGTDTEQKHSRAFLEGIGVKEIGEFEQIEAILKQRYANSDQEHPWTIHESDLNRFTSLANTDRSAIKLFEKYFIFQGADSGWHCPSLLYLDSPYLKTGLDSYYGHPEIETERIALSPNYQKFDPLKQLIPFAQSCGVADRLEIATVNCDANPNREHLHNAPGERFTDYGIDEDFVIPDLDVMFETPSMALSRLVWNTLSNLHLNESILKATFKKNLANNEHTANSRLVHQLKNSAWIPQNAGEFVRPPDAQKDLLPDGFAFDPGWDWLKAIDFGIETEERAEKLRRTREIAAELGISDLGALDDVRQFAALSAETRRKVLEQFQSPVELPTRESADLDRRTNKVRAEAKQAPKRETEMRQRSISKNRDQIKEEKTKPYLRSLYTNTDQVTICQACRDSLPFQLDDGNYYFEAVEFFPDLERHHHQNYLALCPNHAAMFKHANNSKDEVKGRFLALDGNDLDITLAGESVTLYLTETHVADLRAVIEAENTG